MHRAELPEDARPEKVVILKGKVEDESGEVPEGAKVELEELIRKKKDISLEKPANVQLLEMYDHLQ